MKQLGFNLLYFNLSNIFSVQKVGGVGVLENVLENEKVTLILNNTDFNQKSY